MSKVTAGVDRVLFFLLGIILVTLGLWPILIHFGVRCARYLALWVDHDAWARAPQAGWWLWTLVGLTLALTAAGVWLIVENTKVRRILKVPSAASNEKGTVTLQMNVIADGIAKSLTEHEGVTAASRKVAVDRGRPQLTLSITATPETPWAQLRELIATTEADFRAAFPDSTLETVYKVEHDKLKPL